MDVGQPVIKGPLDKFAVVLKKRNSGITNLVLVNYLLVLWLVVDNRPFNLVNHFVFGLFVRALQETYKPPCVRTLTKMEENIALFLFKLVGDA